MYGSLHATVTLVLHRNATQTANYSDGSYRRNVGTLNARNFAQCFVLRCDLTVQHWGVDVGHAAANRLLHAPKNDAPLFPFFFEVHRFAQS
ncbi:unnamed protein product [Toxocara canis]|uniref:Secreted protein n=1 Tax=Toxocara canis TaxID=6265 RepID=A0A183U1N1_TOXCA|nr:unnamed protein product [Toxocara canis]